MNNMLRVCYCVCACLFSPNASFLFSLFSILPLSLFSPPHEALPDPMTNYMNDMLFCTSANMEKIAFISVLYGNIYSVNEDHARLPRKGNRNRARHSKREKVFDRHLQWAYLIELCRKTVIVRLIPWLDFFQEFYTTIRNIQDFHENLIITIENLIIPVKGIITSFTSHPK